MRLGLRGRMAVASAVLVVLVAASFAALLLEVGRLQDTIRLSRRSQDVAASANRLERLVVDVETGAYTTAWLVPSEVFAAGTSVRTDGTRRLFAALDPSARSKWADYRLTPAELPQRILARLAELGA